jgi:hypothetical protein
LEGNNEDIYIFMEFTFRDVNTTFYILVKLPDVTFINYPSPRQPTVAPVCARNVSHLLTKNIGRVIGVRFPAKETVSFEK